MRWNNDETAVSQNTNVKLHKVVLLDCSGSMQGAKYDVAEQGVKQDYEACKGEFADYLLVEFSIDKREQLMKKHLLNYKVLKLNVLRSNKLS